MNLTLIRTSGFALNLCSLSNPQTWSMSLGKFLELTFYGAGYSALGASCPHPHKRDQTLYFGQGGARVSFSYEPISLHDIALPSPAVALEPSRCVPPACGSILACATAEILVP